MTVLVDEHIEHEGYHRLRGTNHEVRHVDLSDQLRKGATDAELVNFSRESRCILVTYDDAFRDYVSESALYGVLYLPDQTLSAKHIADVLQDISTYFDQRTLRGFTTVVSSWS